MFVFKKRKALKDLAVAAKLNGYFFEEFFPTGILMSRPYNDEGTASKEQIFFFISKNDDLTVRKYRPYFGNRMKIGDKVVSNNRDVKFVSQALQTDALLNLESVST